MPRVAKTKGVSMLPEDRARWERLQGDRRTSDFVRQLLDRAEDEQAGGDPAGALAKILTEQSRLPASWFDVEAWEAESAGADVGAIPSELTDAGATIHVGPARDAGLTIGPR